jgi:hypothetical protein
MTHRLGETFLVKCQKQAFSFNKREPKVYCYAFLHLLKRDTCIKHEKTCVPAGSTHVPARHAKMPWLEPSGRQTRCQVSRIGYPLLILYRLPLEACEKYLGPYGRG